MTIKDDKKLTGENKNGNGKDRKQISLAAKNCCKPRETSLPPNSGRVRPEAVGHAVMKPEPSPNTIRVIHPVREQPKSPTVKLPVSRGICLSAGPEKPHPRHIVVPGDPRNLKPVAVVVRDADGSPVPQLKCVKAREVSFLVTGAKGHYPQTAERIKEIAEDTQIKTDDLPSADDLCCKPFKLSDACNLLGGDKEFRPLTTYRDAYMPVDGPTSTKIRPINTLNIYGSSWDARTVHRLTYTPLELEHTMPFGSAPQCNLLGKTPINYYETTHKDCYQRYRLSKVDKILPRGQLKLSKELMTGDSMSQICYRPPMNPEKPDSFMRVCRMLPVGPFEGATIHKSSFTPQPLPAKEPMPWADKGPYKYPTGRLDGRSMYTESYVPWPDSKRTPDMCEPERTFLRAGGHFDPHTSYNDAFQSFGQTVMREQDRQKGNLTFPKAKMDGNTEHRLTYVEHLDYVRAHAKAPCNSSFMGSGSSQYQTSYNYYYTDQGENKPLLIRPRVNKTFRPGEPMEGTSEMQAAYVPQNREASVSYRPLCFPIRSGGSFDGATVHKMTYRPNPLAEKQATPWSDKSPYKVPTVPFDATSIYRISYVPKVRDCSC